MYTYICMCMHIGGALYVSSSTTFIALRVEFVACEAHISGGALRSCGHVRLDHVVMQDCKSNYNGGSISSYGHLEMDECTILRSSAAWNGGALVLHRIDSTRESSSLITNSRFEDCNLAKSDFSSGDGGVASLRSHTSKMENVTFARNRAVDGGAIAVQEHSSCELKSVSIFDSGEFYLFCSATAYAVFSSEMLTR